MISPGSQKATVTGASENIFESILDISDLRSATIQVSGDGDRILSVKTSNDSGDAPQNWFEIGRIINNGLYTYPISFRAMRVECIEHPSGTSVVDMTFSKESPVFQEPKTIDPTAAFKIADKDSQYFGYTDQSGRWYIMHLTASGARYSVGLSEYETNWENRESLTYDYFHNVFKQ